MRRVTIVLLLVFTGYSWAGDNLLDLQQAITYAIDNDPWLKGNTLNERALLAESIADGELPDPSLSLGVLNLAADSLAFDQEPMSQLQVGLTQTFPRGDTLKLKRRRKREQSAAYPFLREDRKARLTLRLSLLWLDTFLARQSVALIENNRYLFDQLVDITHANYTATSGSTRQQDVIRAELELSRLNERLSRLWQGHDVAQKALGEWLPERMANRTLPDNLPSSGLASINDANPEQIRAGILHHPRVQALDRKMASMATGLELARQQYKPEWGLMASYAYRDDGPRGDERADFFSLGISVDLPLFTHNRQDQRVAAANHRWLAVQTERDLLVRELLSGYAQAEAELRRLDERKKRYRQYLLPQMHDQADAALAAYTSDGGDFAEVMRARIGELNTKIMALELTVEQQKTRAKMYYFISHSDAQKGVEGAIK